MAERKNDDDDWGAYYKVVAARPPRDLFRQTMHRFPEVGSASRLAVDLGCGAGNETIALLDAGWTVCAIDQQPEALAHVRDRVMPDQRSRLTLQAASFTDVDLPPSDFIWASVSLPLASPSPSLAGNPSIEDASAHIHHSFAAATRPADLTLLEIQSGL